MLILCYIVSSVRLHETKKHMQNQLESMLPRKSKMSATEKIRVLIKSNGFSNTTHNEVNFFSESGLLITCGDVKQESGGGEVVKITPDDERFQNGSLRVESKKKGEKITITSLQRTCGTPSYRGTLELFSTAEGIVIVNELLMEEYLYAVVPSEMPASYELEALKAQAVCARSYAYNQSRGYSYPEYQAHVDDSTTFQVYGNLAEQEKSTQAVDATCGELIWYGNKVATAYYYSTSCGKSASITAWGGDWKEDNRYLKSVNICNKDGEAYEAQLPWYKWKAVIPEALLSDLIELNTGTEIGNLLNVTVTKIGDGGIAQEITAVGTTRKVVVATENKIRRALGGTGYTIQKQDGTESPSTKLLPSAFFTIEKREGVYTIYGGGHGHGIGMSQNGANEMAKQGMTYKRILTAFYTNVSIE